MHWLRLSTTELSSWRSLGRRTLWIASLRRKLLRYLRLSKVLSSVRISLLWRQHLLLLLLLSVFKLVILRVILLWLVNIVVAVDHRQPGVVLSSHGLLLLLLLWEREK